MTIPIDRSNADDSKSLENTNIGGWTHCHTSVKVYATCCHFTTCFHALAALQCVFLARIKRLCLHATHISHVSHASHTRSMDCLTRFANLAHSLGRSAHPSTRSTGFVPNRPIQRTRYTVLVQFVPTFNPIGRVQFGSSCFKLVWSFINSVYQF